MWCVYGSSRNCKDKLCVTAIFSYAFNTVGRDRLMMLLRKKLHVSDDTLLWFDTYLNNRSVCVKGQGCGTGFSLQHCGISQGSALSPLLYNFYMADLAKHLRLDGDMHLDVYADDLTITVRCTSWKKCEEALQKAMDRVNEWCKKSGCKVNRRKTEVMCWCKDTEVDFTGKEYDQWTLAKPS